MLLNIGAIIVAVLLIGVIMLQMQGKGLSSSFGGGELYRSKQSIDKLLIWITTILTILFGILSISLLIPR